MAKELQPIDRQILTPTTPISPNRAFESLGQATGEIAGLVANKLAEVAMQQYGVAGSLDALKGDAPKNLALPVNQATAAYNKAVIDTEARQLVTKAHDMMSEAYTRASDPSKFNAQTPAQFGAELTGIVDGVLENTRPENRAAVQDALAKASGRFRVQMLDDSIKYDNVQMAQSFDRDMAKLMQELDAAQISKDKATEASVWQTIGNTLNDYSIINEQIKNKLPEITKAIKEKTAINAVVANYVEAYGQGKEAEFLNTLATSKPEGLTDQQYIAAQTQVLKLNRQNNQLQTQMQSQMYNQGIFEIKIGKYPTLQSLDDAYASKLTASNMWQLRSAWVTTMAGEFKKEDNFRKVEEARKAGPQEVAKTSNEARNDHYQIKQQMILDEVNQALPPDQQKKSLSLTEKMALIVTPSGAPVEDYNTELAYALKGSYQVLDEKTGKMVLDVQRTLDGLNAYRYAWENRSLFGDVLKGLDAEADDIAQYVLSLSDKSEVMDLDLMKQAWANIKDKSDATRISRQERLDQYMSTAGGGISQIDATYQKLFGSRPANGMSDPHYGIFQKLFKYYFMGVSNGNADAALKITTAQLRDWGKSKFGAEDDTMYRPPEKAVAFANLNFWLSNQLLLGLNQSLKELEGQGYFIRRPEWMKKVVPEGSVTEQDLFDTNYLDPGKETSAQLTPEQKALQSGRLRDMTAVILGIERPVYIGSTKETGTSMSGEAIYQWYYFDDFGNQQWIPRAGTTGAAAQFNIEPLNVFLPEVFKSFKEDDFDKFAQKYGSAEFKAKNPGSTYTGIVPGSGMDVLTPGLSEWKYIEENKERLKQELMAAKDGETDTSNIKFENVPQATVPVATEDETKPEDDNGPPPGSLSFAPSSPGGDDEEEKKYTTREVVSIIHEAATEVGVDKTLLESIARIESSLKPKPPVGKKSSAKGLFQFTKSTWKKMVSLYGDKYKITEADIYNPRANAIMGALFTRDHITKYEKEFGETPTETHLYAMHMLGNRDAMKFFNALRTNPKASIKDIKLGERKVDGKLIKEPVVENNARLLNGTVEKSWANLQAEVKAKLAASRRNK